MFNISLKRVFLLPFLILTCVWIVNAKEIPAKSNIQVYDYAGVLNPGEVENLQKILKDWQDSTSIEMAIIIDNSLEDEDIFEYSLKIAQSWGIGDKSTNNGILLYVSVGDKKIFMHIGPGLQGVIPDALGKRIIENQLKPAFREQKYGEGLSLAILTLQQLAAGTYEGGENEGVDGIFGIFFILFIILFVVAVIFLFRSASRSHTYSRSGDYQSGGGMWIFPGGFGSGSGSGYDGNDSGGFDFGGGDFDGGGAGGDW
ncbi:MAG: TPM domain-containing protein [Bacteroidetes bacterium]|nr:TPM domain-containing protein [Bacteroidota bacterium]